MITSVDTNILFDIVVDDPDFFEQSSRLVQAQSNIGSMVICPVVYSELLVFFLEKHELNSAVKMARKFLDDLGIQIVDFEKDDFNLAAEAWRKIEQQRIKCPKCGTANEFYCSSCRSQIHWRNHVISDFLIGAHAQNHSEILLTRDKAYYRKYFRIKTLP